MSFIDLILTVCTLANPAFCEETRIPYASGGTLRQCMLEAPPAIAQWSEEHPARRVVRWRCAWPGSQDEDI
ncbi:MAG TPA: hypothetical protein VFE89_03710 [Beijerinckiaceae bacterium]|jgi:hypothetical protein|nr:hypothetical protein [Beijerinckiaceae bacterium]